MKRSLFFEWCVGSGCTWCMRIAARTVEERVESLRGKTELATRSFATMTRLGGTRGTPRGRETTPSPLVPWRWKDANLPYFKSSRWSPTLHDIKLPVPLRNYHVARCYKPPHEIPWLRTNCSDAYVRTRTVNYGFFNLSDFFRSLTQRGVSSLSTSHVCSLCTSFTLEFIVICENLSRLH